MTAAHTRYSWGACMHSPDCSNTKDACYAVSSPLGPAYEGSFSFTGKSAAVPGIGVFPVSVTGETRGVNDAGDTYTIQIDIGTGGWGPISDGAANFLNGVKVTSSVSDTPLYLLTNYTADDVPDGGCLQVCIVLRLQSSISIPAAKARIYAESDARPQLFSKFGRLLPCCMTPPSLAGLCENIEQAAACTLGWS